MTGLNLHSLFPPKRSEGGTESFSPLIARLAPLANSPFWGLSKGCLINITKDILKLSSPRRFQRLSVLFTRNRDEKQIYVSYYKSQYHTLLLPNIYCCYSFLSHAVLALILILYIIFESSIYLTSKDYVDTIVDLKQTHCQVFLQQRWV